MGEWFRASKLQQKVLRLSVRIPAELVKQIVSRACNGSTAQILDNSVKKHDVKYIIMYNTSRSTEAPLIMLWKRRYINVILTYLLTLLMVLNQ
jgi:hypothetical protein